MSLRDEQVKRYVQAAFTPADRDLLLDTMEFVAAVARIAIFPKPLPPDCRVIVLREKLVAMFGERGSEWR